MIDEYSYIIPIRDTIQVAIPDWWRLLVNRIFDIYNFKTSNEFNNYMKETYGAVYYVKSGNAYLIFESEEEKFEFILKHTFE